jgi:hypothetical protein
MMRWITARLVLCRTSQILGSGLPVLTFPEVVSEDAGRPARSRGCRRATSLPLLPLLHRAAERGDPQWGVVRLVRGGGYLDLGSSDRVAKRPTRLSTSPPSRFGADRQWLHRGLRTVGGLAVGGSAQRLGGPQVAGLFVIIALFHQLADQPSCSTKHSGCAIRTRLWCRRRLKSGCRKQVVGLAKVAIQSQLTVKTIGHQRHAVTNQTRAK